MLATLGTSARLASKSDKAADRGTAALIDAIKVKSPDARVFKVAARALGDPGEWAENNPFATVEIYDFQEKKGILFDSGMAWGEADRMAIQHLTGRVEQ